MTIKDLINKLRGMGQEQEEEHEEMDDWETRDKVLKGLRREKRRQMDMDEKENLKKSIAEYRKQKTREHLWGLGKKEKEKLLIKALANKKKGNILKQKRMLLSQKSILNNRKEEFKKKAAKSSYLGKSGLL